MRIVVDQAKCVGHGRCYAIAPDLFKADDYGQGHAVTDEVGADVRAHAEAAAANCPESAITILD